MKKVDKKEIEFEFERAQYPACCKESYNNRVDYQQEIIDLFTNKENMETTTGYLTKSNKSLFELTESEKIELLNLLKEGKR